MPIPKRILPGLVSAEDFLEYFGVDYDPEVVRVARIQILKRFHDHLEAYRTGEGEPGPDDYQRLLTRAYEECLHRLAGSGRALGVPRRIIAEVPVADLMADLAARNPRPGRAEG